MRLLHRLPGWLPLVLCVAGCLAILGVVQAGLHWALGFDVCLYPFLVVCMTLVVSSVVGRVRDRLRGWRLRWVHRGTLEYSVRDGGRWCYAIFSADVEEDPRELDLGDEVWSSQPKWAVDHRALIEARISEHLRGTRIMINR